MRFRRPAHRPGPARTGTWTLAAVVSGLLVVPTATCAAEPHARPAMTQSAQANLNFGAFAGEVWRDGTPHAVAADWTVPAIAAGSNAGFAGTWIGIQCAASLDPSQEPFLQVGVNETRSGSGATAHSRYYAFFSDTAQDFKPTSLFDVRPGDAVDASLHLNGGRWTVGIRDLTSGRSVSFSTRQEATGAFDQAEWLQEDATDARTQGQVGYPVLSPVSFTDLEVNGVAPSPSVLDSQWMTEHGQSLAPASVTGNGFTLETQGVSGTANRYLKIAEPFAEVNDWFATQASGWEPSTPTVESADERSTLIQSIEQEIAQLQSQAWPTAVQPLIDELISARRSEMGFLQTQPRATPSAIHQWIHGFDRADITPAVRQLHRTIGVPDLLPTSG